MGIFNKKILFSVILSIFLTINYSILDSFANNNKANGPQYVEIIAKDNFILTGNMMLPANASIKNKVPLVIFAHSLGRTKDSWGDLPVLLNKKGYATLTLDLRGHGKSIFDKNGKKKYWPSFVNADYKRFPEDIISSIKHVSENYPEINSNNIILIGADIGANSAIIAGSMSSKNIKGLILLSPTLSYKGLETRMPLVAYGAHPILIITSEQDKASTYAGKELLKYAQGKKSMVTLENGGIGVNLLKNNPKTKPAILNWIDSNTFLAQTTPNK